MSRTVVAALSKLPATGCRLDRRHSGNVTVGRAEKKTAPDRYGEGGLPGPIIPAGETGFFPFWGRKNEGENMIVVYDSQVK